MQSFTPPLILASGSPRRSALLAGLGYRFTVEVTDADESFAPDVPAYEVPILLAGRKALASVTGPAEAVVLAADTVVIAPDGRLLNKPADEAEALEMLHMLQGATHTVITGCCLRVGGNLSFFADAARVTMAHLTDDELLGYIHRAKPFDKAGSYGAQDWIGMAGIERIEGSYFTVMGLPTHLVYRKLREAGIKVINE